MTSAGSSARAFMSIGEVLGALRAEFPDVSISKIRFLESEGLVEPERTPAGYRKFSHDDVGRLRYVLGAQRDHYLPLRVIKEHLSALDRGLEAPPITGGRPRAPRALSSTDGLPGADHFAAGNSDVSLTQAELLAESTLDAEQLRSLEQFGVIAKPANGFYDADALLIASTVAELARYGIEARHLRAFRTAAERETGLFEQVVTPLVRQRGAESAARAQETVRELAALSVRLHATLVKVGLRSVLGT